MTQLMNASPRHTCIDKKAMFFVQAQKMVETMAEAFEVTFKQLEHKRERRMVYTIEHGCGVNC